MKEEYYVYAYLDRERKATYQYGDFTFSYEPFYIGKGIRNRKDWYKYVKKGIDPSSPYVESHSLKINKLHKMISSGNEPIVLVICENMSENDAFILEKKLIQLIGKRIDNSGPLTNVTDGGEGGTFRHTITPEHAKLLYEGRKNKGFHKMNDKTKEALRQSKKNGWKPSEDSIKRYSAAAKRNMTGRILDENWRKSIGESLRNIPKTEKHKNAISKSRMKPVVMKNSDGEILEIFDSAYHASLSTGVPRTSISRLCINNKTDDYPTIINGIKIYFEFYGKI